MRGPLTKILQHVLLVMGSLALLALIVEIVLSLAATTHGSTPVRVVQVKAGPYPLTISLYKDPVDAGFALPFSIAPQKGIHDKLQFDVTTIPGRGVDATPVHASLLPDISGGVQGTAEITVRGTWLLHVVVTGSQGKSMVEIPIRAVAPLAIPLWSGWLVGSVPTCALLCFLLLQRSKKRMPGRSYSLS